MSDCLYVRLLISVEFLNPALGWNYLQFSSMVELPGCRLELFSWKDIKRVRLFVCMNNCPFVCLSICPSVCLFFCLRFEILTDKQMNTLISFQLNSSSLQPGSSTMELNSSNLVMGFKFNTDKQTDRRTDRQTDK